MKKLLLILLLSISQIAFANTNTADSFSSTFKLLDGKKPIYITSGGSQISVDPIGDEKAIKLFKRF